MASISWAVQLAVAIPVEARESVLEPLGDRETLLAILARSAGPVALPASAPAWSHRRGSRPGDCRACDIVRRSARLLVTT